MAQQLAGQGFPGDVAGLEADEGLDDFTGDGIGLANDPSFGDRRVLHQRALDLERPDQVASRLDHIVGAADKPKITVDVAHREIAGQVPAVGKALRLALGLADIAAEHRRPAGPQCQLTSGHRRLGSTRLHGPAPTADPPRGSRSTASRARALRAAPARPGDRVSVVPALLVIRLLRRSRDALRGSRHRPRPCMRGSVAGRAH